MPLAESSHNGLHGQRKQSVSPDVSSGADTGWSDALACSPVSRKSPKSSFSPNAKPQVQRYHTSETSGNSLMGATGLRTHNPDDEDGYVIKTVPVDHDRDMRPHLQYEDDNPDIRKRESKEFLPELNDASTAADTGRQRRSNEDQGAIMPTPLGLVNTKDEGATSEEEGSGLREAVDVNMPLPRSIGHGVGRRSWDEMEGVKKKRPSDWRKLQTRTGRLNNKVRRKIVKSKRTKWDSMMSNKESFRIDRDSVDIFAFQELEETAQKHTPLNTIMPGSEDFRSNMLSSFSAAVERFSRLVVLFPCVPVISPNHPWVEAWDLLVAILLVYVACVSPYDVAFLPGGTNGLSVMNLVVDLLFLVDMCLQFNLAFPGNFGELVRDKVHIQTAYLKGWFCLDALSIFPFDLIPLSDDHGDSLRMVRLAKLFKLLRLFRMSRVFTRFEARMAINYSMMQLTNFILILFLLCHWLACGFYLTIKLEENIECIQLVTVAHWDAPGCCYSWFDCSRYMNFAAGPSSGRKYFLSLYWASGEVFSVGSDIFPVTDWERAYLLFARLISGIAYTYIIGAVCGVFGSMTRDQSTFYENMDRLNKFLVDKRIQDPELCSNLRLFFRYAYSHHSSTRNMTNIFTTISPHLRSQVAFKVHSNWLRKMDLFRGMHLSPGFYLALALKLEVGIFAPLEHIIEPHHPRQKVFVVDKGIVISNGSVRMLGDHFGDDAISTWRYDAVREYSATAYTHGKYNMIRTRDFFEILQRPQFNYETRRVRGRILKMRMCEISLKFLSFMKDALEEPSYQDACINLRRRLHFVMTNQMDLIYCIFKRFYDLEQPSVDYPYDDFGSYYSSQEGDSPLNSAYYQGSCKSLVIDSSDSPKPQVVAGDSKLTSDNYDSDNSLKNLHNRLGSTKIHRRSRLSSVNGDPTSMETEDVADMLLKVGIQDPNLAEKLVCVECMTLRKILSATQEQLHLAGIPVGHIMNIEDKKAMLQEEYADLLG